MILIFRIVALLFLGWVIIRLLKSVVQKAFSNVTEAPPGDAPQIADMEKDPVCGSYVSIEHAVTGDFSGERKYFCSDKCLGEYRDKQSSG